MTLDFLALARDYGHGLTGNIATGKSTVAGILRDQGLPVIDADWLARTAVAPGSPALGLIAERFGDEVLAEDGSLDRRRMRQLIFADADRRRELEEIVHPAIQALLAVSLQEQGLLEKPRPWFYEATLLYETGFAERLKAIWATTCHPDRQKERVMVRDGLDSVEAERILRQQGSNEAKADKADRVITTDGTTDEVEAQVLRILRSDDLLPEGGEE